MSFNGLDCLGSLELIRLPILSRPESVLFAVFRFSYFSQKCLLRYFYRKKGSHYLRSKLVYTVCIAALGSDRWTLASDGQTEGKRLFSA